MTGGQAAREREKESLAGQVRSVFRSRPFSDRRKLSLFAEEMSSLLAAGLTVTESLSLLAEQESRKEKTALQQAVRAISSGESFRAGMASCRCFPPLFLSLAEVGELSGTLPESLERAGRYYKREQDFITKLREALAYPVFMIFFSCIVFFLMITVILPSFLPLFEALGLPVPAVTEELIAAGRVLSERGSGLVLFLLFFFSGFYLYTRKGEGKRKWDGLLFRSVFLRRLLLIRFCFSLSTLLEGGRTLSESLEDTVPVVRNERACREIRRVSEEIRRGADFAEELQAGGFCLPVVYHLVRTGMRSGELPHFLEEAAKILLYDTERASERFRLLAEPVMLLAVGGTVLLLLFSVVLPVLQAAGHLESI